MRFIIVATFVAFCSGYIQEFTYYTGYDYTGDSTTIKSKEPDLISVEPDIIQNHMSRCYWGLWGMYNELNYTGGSGVYVNGITERFCTNTSALLYSARYLGPEDLSTPSISFYSETAWRETELVVTSIAFGGIPFTPKALVSTGWSNWTIYSGENFNGTTMCYESTAEIHYVAIVDEIYGGQINSVLKGCIGRIDTYLKADSLETKLSKNL